jgi:hypothetical protein
MRTILHRSNRWRIAAEGVVVARVVEGVGEGSTEADALVELADEQQLGIAGELTGRRLDDYGTSFSPEIILRKPKFSVTLEHPFAELVGEGLFRP